MKRFRRWVVNGLTAISLVCFVIAVMLWIRGYWVFDTIFWSNDSNGRMADVDWFQGRLSIEYVSGKFFWALPPGIHYYRNRWTDIPDWGMSMVVPGLVDWNREFLGIYFGHADEVSRKPSSDRFSYTWLGVPFWVIATAAAIPPGFGSRSAL
jgi:hypothetical protein